MHLVLRAGIRGGLACALRACALFVCLAGLVLVAYAAEVDLRAAADEVALSATTALAFVPDVAVPVLSFHAVACLVLAGFLLAAVVLWWSGRGKTRPAASHTPGSASMVSESAGGTRIEQQLSASVTAVTQPAASSTVVLRGVRFQLAHAQTGRLIWTYSGEGAALAFVRDVVRLRSHRDAAQFELRMVDNGARTTTLARGEQLVRLALEDRVL